MSMMCRPKWPFLHMYRSHDMRHVDFRGLTGSQRTTPGLGCHSIVITQLRYLWLRTTRVEVEVNISTLNT